MKPATSWRAANATARASGWKVCTITRPGASRPLRPGELRDSWNVRSSARKSGIAEPRVRVDDGGERDAREVVALRDHLRAEQDGAIGSAKRSSASASAAGLVDGVGVEPDPLELRARAPRARARAAACRRRCARARAIRTPGRSRRALGARSGGSGGAVARAARARRRSPGSGCVAPHARQWMAGATPRRLSRRIALPPRSATPPERGEERRRTAGSPPRGGCRRRAPAAAAPRAGRRARAARAAPSSRAGASRCRRRRRRPRAPRAWPRRCARRSADRTPACTTSRAPRRRRSARGRATGANTAERAPTTMRASPRAIRSRSSRRSASVSPEWSIATRSPNRAGKRPTVCGVSAISGTSTIAPRPRSSAAAHARR